ncbi:MAG: hypothetical protein FWE82_03035, partial [Defluviitaleaceae bacterium]|nr:hypothetical protein [Defluviitaleaceae bacterium]
QLNAVLNKFVRDKQTPEVIEKARRLRSESDESDESLSHSQRDSVLFDYYVRDLRRSFTQLDELVKEEGWNKNVEAMHRFTMAVNGVKSPMLGVNRPDLSEWARQLELGGRERNEAAVSLSAPGFIKEFRTMLDMIESERIADAEGADEDADELKNKFLAVEMMCAEFNRDGVKKIVAEILNCSKETRAVLDSIIKFVLLGSFEEAGSAAIAYAAELSQRAAAVSIAINRDYPIEPDGA